MLQASTSNPIPGDGFSRTTKDSMIRKFLEGKLKLWAGKQKEGKRNKYKTLPGSTWRLFHWKSGLPHTWSMEWVKVLCPHEHRPPPAPISLLQGGRKFPPLQPLIWINRLPSARPLFKCTCLFLFNQNSLSIYYDQSIILDVGLGDTKKSKIKSVPSRDFTFW